MSRVKFLCLALQPLVPYLIRFVSRHVYLSVKNINTIRLALLVLQSLVRNKHLDLGLYSHHILPLILSSLLSEKMGDTDSNGHGRTSSLKTWFSFPVQESQMKHTK